MYGRLWSSGKTSRIEYKNYKNPKLVVQKSTPTEYEKITKLNNYESDVDTLTMGLRLYDGVEISKLENKSFINLNALKKLQKQNIVSLRNNTLKVNKNHMIKLNSIIDFLINP